MTHPEMEGLYDLYLLGVLDSEEAAEITEHLNRNCEYCAAEISAASSTVASLASMVELKRPPAQLRAKVLSLAASPGARRSPWPVALALAASLALLIWGLGERASLDKVFRQLQEVSRQRNELRSVVAVLSESDTRTIQFGSTQELPHGRVFISRNGGVVFVGGRLPEPGSGKTFELWLVPAKGNPEPAGLFRPNAEGVSVNVLSRAINPSEFAAVAVSVEPAAGSPQPTTKPIIVVPIA